MLQILGYRSNAVYIYSVEKNQDAFGNIAAFNVTFCLKTNQPAFWLIVAVFKKTDYNLTPKSHKARTIN